MSKPLIINIPHGLGRDSALQRLRDGLGQIRKQIKVVDFEERREDYSVHFSAGGLGQKVTGRVDVEERNVRVEVKLPAIFTTIADKIRGRVETEGQRLLGN